MREIKFKAWDKVKNEWVLGKEPFNIIGEVTVFDAIKNYSLSQFDDIEILQFTGLLDKNGKEIYEGDIIRKTEQMFMTGAAPRDKIKGSVKKVIFHEASFRLNTTLSSKKYHLASQYIRYYGFEVIGNIYENKDLIK